MLLGFLTGFGKVVIYFIVCVVILSLLTHFFKVPKKFQKSLHLILLFSLLVFCMLLKTGGFRIGCTYIYGLSLHCD